MTNPNETITLLREAVECTLHKFPNFEFSTKEKDDFYVKLREAIAATEATPVADEKPKATISHAEAKEIAIRFIDGHFNNKGEHARISIPANPNRDDDIRLLEYIKQQSNAAPNQSPRSAQPLGASGSLGNVQNSIATPTEEMPVPHDETTKTKGE